MMESVRAPGFWLWNLVGSSGVAGVLGWVSLLVLIFFAAVTIARVHRVKSSSLPDIFFAAAHMQTLFFLLTNGVMAILFMFAIVSTGIPWLVMWGCSTVHILLSLAINTGVALFLVALVALFARRRPAFRFTSWLGLGILGVDFALLIALPLHVLAQTR